ncbi:MAG TPA: response regulator [Anaerolineae bacterium]|nr:response regulator [Anaerolineae bacterium]HQI85952.1 response regulator [Anaerolineae bacterium]
MSAVKILIVEDQIIVARDEQHILEALGYNVVGATATGENAITLAGTLQPDLVLMDIMLKGDMDGIEAARHIRERFDIPVIFVTAYADQATLQRAKLTEPFGYILKPFEEHDLATTIEMALYKHQMDRRLKESEQWFSATLRSIGDAVIATDVDGRVRFMNPLAETLTGWQQAEAVGRKLTQVFHTINESKAEPNAAPDARAYPYATSPNSTDKVLIPRSGPPLLIEDNSAPIKDDRGNTTGLVLVFRDITERRRAEREREQLISELDAFAHTVAHDLKNPLSIIVGSTETLEYDFASLSESVFRQYLRAIAAKGRKMSSIIDALLLLASARQSHVQLKPVEMGEVVTESLERVSNLIEQRGAQVISPGAWPAVRGYAPWIEEVWVNYLSNAIKYGGRPNEGIPPVLELGFDAPLTVGDAAYACFWVQDNGMGLTPEQQQQLFTPFVRLDQVRTEGYGLGLSIVQRVIEKLGGRVGVQSTVGQGSRFYFTLSLV